MDYLKSQKSGLCYESGIAIEEARKSLVDTLKDWNPPGTKLEDIICIYFHTAYCTRREHKDYCSSNCTTKSKMKKEREAAWNGIAGESVEKELQRSVKDCGNVWLILSLLNRVCSVVLKLPYNYADNRQF